MVPGLSSPWAAGIAGVALCLGLVGGFWFRGGPELMLESPAAAIQLRNATVLERQPAQPVPSAILSAAKELAGSKLERAAALTVQPRQPNCEPIEIELGTVRMDDGTQRLIARSDQATVTSGVDIPIATSTRREFKWAAGALYDPVTDRYGVFVDRDLGRLRVGVDAIQDERGSFAAIVRVGIRF